MTNNELEWSADMIAELSKNLSKDKQLSMVAYLLGLALIEISEVLAKRDNQITRYIGEQPSSLSH